MTFPVGPLLSNLAKRILVNLDLIEQQAPSPDEVEQNRAPYSDTQLLISLLGVLIFPHERTPDALGQLLNNYKALSKVMTIEYPKRNGAEFEIVEASGDRHRIDPTSVTGLPRLLRNSIAHFNIRPIEKNGRFAGVRVWNRDDAGIITLVADLDFDALRPLARHILEALAQSENDLSLDDPPDPLQTLQSQIDRATPRTRKPPRIIDSTWAQFLKASQDNYDEAKRTVDRILRDKARELNIKFSR